MFDQEEQQKTQQKLFNKLVTVVIEHDYGTAAKSIVISGVLSKMLADVCTNSDKFGDADECQEKLITIAAEYLEASIERGRELRDGGPSAH